MRSTKHKTRNMRTCKLNFLIICLMCVTSAVAQTRKLEKTYKSDPKVKIDLDATHTKILVETWDRNEVQIEAYLESENADKAAVQRELENWKLETGGSAGEIRILSRGGSSWSREMPDLSGLEEPLSRLPEMLVPLQEMMGPLLESISGNPLPPEFYENMGDLRFDYEAYRKEGDAYLKRWEEKIEKNFGKDFEQSMEQWAARFEKDTALWKKDMEMRMEAWGEDFGKKMEAWGEDFGKEMEAWGESFGKDMEAWAKEMEKEVESANGNVKGKAMLIKKSDSKKIIKLRMPKEARLNLKLRHGEVNLSGRANDLNADLSHSRLSAGTLSGRKTEVRAAYTPLKIGHWEYGILNASYVQDLVIEKATSIKLNSNSSEVNINRIEETGILKGTFGELVIREVAGGFKSLDITLENSDLELKLPDAAYTIDYTGTKSKVKYPEKLSLESSRSYDTQKLKGFNRNRNTGAAINITAGFSDVLLK